MSANDVSDGEPTPKRQKAYAPTRAARVHKQPVKKQAPQMAQNSATGAAQTNGNSPIQASRTRELEKKVTVTEEKAEALLKENRELSKKLSSLEEVGGQAPDDGSPDASMPSELSLVDAELKNATGEIEKQKAVVKAATRLNRAKEEVGKARQEYQKAMEAVGKVA